MEGHQQAAHPPGFAAAQGQQQTLQPGARAGGPSGGEPPAPSPTLRHPTVAAVAREEVVTASPDDTIGAVVELMEERKVGSVVLVEDDRPVGIVTDRKVALSLNRTSDPANTPVEDVMTTDLVTASTDDEVFEVLAQMSERGIRRIPIVDDGGALAGILALDDVLVYLESGFRAISEAITDQFPRE